MAGFLTLLCLAAAAVWLLHRSTPASNTRTATEKATAITAEIHEFAGNIRQDSLRRRKPSTQRATHRLRPFPFDPNTADSATLARVGLQDWQIRNLMKYRAKGGRWRKPDDFARLYGLSEEDFRTLRPYLAIAPDTETRKKAKRQAVYDSLKRHYPEKYAPGTKLQLNRADTTALKGIPGIGSYYAGKICRYRERLGGFVSIAQLKEIEGLPEGIEQWFELTADTAVRRTPVNRTDFKGLVRHPYLNYEQVKAICSYRRKYGSVTRWEDLSSSEAFTAADFERLRPYFSFE